MGVLREVSGFALLVAGLIGVVVPVIPGIPLILAGGLILAPKYPAIRRIVRRVRRWGMGTRRAPLRRKSNGIEVKSQKKW
jgi:hypothetical protein